MAGADLCLLYANSSACQMGQSEAGGQQGSSVLLYLGGFPWSQYWLGPQAPELVSRTPQNSGFVQMDVYPDEPTISLAAKTVC